MKSEDLFAVIGEVDERKIEVLDEMIELKEKKGVFDMKKNRKKWLKIGVAAACVMAVIGGVWFFAQKNKNKMLGEEIELSEASTKGVSVHYTDKYESFSGEYDLVWLSEEELFELNEWNDSIFRGEIENVQNIVCNFDGDKEYRGLVEIRVEKVYRGDIKTDTTVSVLVPHAIDMEVWVEDSETISCMKKGMKGIFVTLKYDEDATWWQNGETLMLMDIAEYGFADGSRWMFLEKGKKIIYNRDAYESLEAENLDEVEAYVLKMLEKVE